MDNQIFNVNGRGQRRLEKAIALWYDPNDYLLDADRLSFQGYCIDPKYGFILFKHVSDYDKKATKFPTAINLEIVVGMVWAWLKSDDRQPIPFGKWENDIDTDGSTELGWRVYVEDWGHVGEFRNVVAIKPVYLWYGK